MRRRLLRWYTIAMFGIALGLAAFGWSLVASNNWTDTRSELDQCRDLAGEHAHLCELIDWKTTNDVGQAPALARCRELAASLGKPLEICFHDWRPKDHRWQPVPVAMPRPVAEPANARPSD